MNLSDVADYGSVQAGYSRFIPEMARPCGNAIRRVSAFGTRDPVDVCNNDIVVSVSVLISIIVASADCIDSADKPRNDHEVGPAERQCSTATKPTLPAVREKGENQYDYYPWLFLLDIHYHSTLHVYKPPSEWRKRWSISSINPSRSRSGWSRTHKNML